MHDLSPDQRNFRCRTDGMGQTSVEVLRGVAQEPDALQWVLSGSRSGRYRTGSSGDHTGPAAIDLDGTVRRSHIAPGEDPLQGNEPMPEQRGPIPAVILVPVAEWDAWVRQHPAGAEWDAQHEAAILEQAHRLGWRPPDGYVSPAGWRPSAG